LYALYNGAGHQPSAAESKKSCGLINNYELEQFQILKTEKEKLEALGPCPTLPLTRFFYIL
jgi:hypothetical protein